MIVRDWVRETDDQAVNSDSKRRLPRGQPLSEVRAPSRR
jgi:hypothetical protein